MEPGLQRKPHFVQASRRQRRWWVFIGCLLLLASGAFWFYASLVEFQTGRRLWPWSAYAFCGRSQPAALPLDYQQARLHLDLYTTGAGQNAEELTRLLHCGVERYGASFIPSFGVLNDGEGSAEIFVPPETLLRNLRLARAAGVSEIWLFGANGLNGEYLAALREALPLEPLPAASTQ